MYPTDAQCLRDYIFSLAIPLIYREDFMLLLCKLAAATKCGCHYPAPMICTTLVCLEKRTCIFSAEFSVVEETIIEPYHMIKNVLAYN
jgi:hypothetical protein